MSRFRRIADIVGRVLIGAGVVLLLFTAYQVWGTSIEEGHAQAALRTQLRQQSVGTGADQALATASARDALPTGPPDTAPSTPEPAEGSPVGEVRIPAIGLDQIVVEGSGEADLRKGPGHYVGTPLPGQNGNVAIAGHRTTYGHPFYSLDALKIGDPIVLTTLQGVFVYDVAKAPFVVSPTDTTVVKSAFFNMITLTTCNPRFSASTRLIVQGVLVHSRLFSAASGLPPSGSVPVSAARPSPSVLNGSLAGDSSIEVANTVGWGAALLVVGIVVFVAVQRLRINRWLAYGGGVVVALVLLWFFFGAISPLLPASF